MKKRVIENLDLKIKYTIEYLENGGYDQLEHINILRGLMEVKKDANGKVYPETVNPIINSFMMTVLQEHFEPPVFSTKRITEYISTLQKSLYFNQENIDTPDQFDKIYRKFKSEKNTLFRGQKEAKWRLYSKLQRNWVSQQLGEKHRLTDLLKNLIHAGLDHHRARITELSNVDHQDTINDIAVLGFLQHHGCPTPLLDWTFKFENALYFAFDDVQPKKHNIEIEDYVSVYHIEEKHFESASLRNIMLQALDKVNEQQLESLIDTYAGKDESLKVEMTEKLKGKSMFDSAKYFGSGLIKNMADIFRLIEIPVTYFSDRNKDSGIIFSLENNQNIVNQQGVFTWNADPNKPLEMVGNEQYRQNHNELEDGGYHFCHCFNINKSLAGYVNEILTKEGITKDFIYPTVDIETSDIFKLCI